MTHGQTLNSLTADVVTKVDQAYSHFEPDVVLVLVQGDTTTVMASAIAAFNRDIPVMHLEAGLRSGDLRSPFPEEANRKVVSQLSSARFAPTESAKSNLLAEGVDPRQIFITGNTVNDAYRWAVERGARMPHDRLKDISDDTRVVLLTAHRRENIGAPMRRIGRALRHLADMYEDVFFVWATHKNPKVQEYMLPELQGIRNVVCLEPVDYDEFANLMARSTVILTDSGGIQEEAPSTGTPVLVLRENTERPEAIWAGTAKLIGTDTDRIVHEVALLLESESEYAKMATSTNPYGDGCAAERVLQAIRALLVGAAYPDDFSPV